MKTADLNTILIDSYLTMLKNLSPNNKLELISRLSKSMKTTRKEKKDITLESLYGAWESDQAAEELVAEIKAARNFSRKREEL